MRLLIKNARTLETDLLDILLDEKTILKVGNNLSEDHDEVIDLKGEVFVSPGWIDIHTHACEHFELYSDNPDEIGYKTGVTSIVDAGTTGADFLSKFYNDSRKYKTRVYALLNVARQGILTQDELSSLENLDYALIKKTVEAYPDYILGLKARMSASVVGEQGIKPLELAKQYSRSLGLPLMVHVGSMPPKLDEVVNLLDKGDIVTHTFNNKGNGIIRDGKVESFVIEARKRGVIFDVGHGKESFSFTTAKEAFDLDFLTDTISSDIYRRNRLDGPVYNLATTMNKLLYVGYDLKKVIDSVTIDAACAVGLKKMGKIEESYLSDLTFYQYKEINQELVDSQGQSVMIEKGLVPTGVVLKGVYYEIK